MRRGSHFIDGEWVDSASDAVVEVTNPTDETVIGSVPAGHADDVDRAVAAASRAFPAWAATSLEERVALVDALASALEKQAEELTSLVVEEVGTPSRVARWAQVGLGIADLRGAVEGAKSVEWEQRLGNSIVVRQPVGVAACITPWNYPLHQITAKVGAALVAGCTVVVKPSEVAPFTAEAFARTVAEVGIPAGVVNLVHGLGPIVGEALAVHPDVRLVSFTGSTQAGKRVAALAADTVKRVALELGGKSASVILDDADLSEAVPKTLRSSFLNGGQSCNAQTRMIVPRSRLSDVEQALEGAVAAYRLGRPEDPDTKLGPMVTESQRDRVVSYIESGIEAGARLLVGGPQKPEGFEQGYYVQPTIFSDVDPGMRIAREEIFGPVLSVIAVDGEEEAIAVANDTPYGIAAGVWSVDADHAMAVARRLDAAQVDVNGGGFNPLAPFGGFKESGIGRENGEFGIEEYLEIKSIQQPHQRGSA